MPIPILAPASTPTRMSASPTAASLSPAKATATHQQEPASAPSPTPSGTSSHQTPSVKAGFFKTANLLLLQDDAAEGKRFVLTRMDAFSADKWARHILQAAIRGGARVGADLAEAGVAGLASLGIEIFGFMEEADLDRALDRLMQCIALRPDPAHPETTRAVIATDFEEPETLGLVRAEAFRLHVGFLLAAAHQLFPVVAALLGDTAQEKPRPSAA